MPLLGLTLHRIAGLARLLSSLVLLAFAPCPLPPPIAGLRKPGHAAAPTLLLMRRIIFAAWSKRCSSVDLRNRHAGTVGDAGAAGTVDDRGSRRSAGVIERMMASVRSISSRRTARVPYDDGHARNHAKQVLHRAELAHLLKLVEEVVQAEGTVGDLDGGLAGLFLVELLLRLLDERQDVAHVEDARRHTVRVEDLEVLQDLRRWRRTGSACRSRMPRTARPHRGRRHRAWEHHAGEVHAFVERLGRLHRRPGRSSRR